jgi:hypothetical protein
MPYAPNSKNLPAYIKNVDVETRRKWIDIFNTVSAKEGEQMAFLIANTWLKRQIKKQSIETRTNKQVERVSFEIDSSKETITRTENGDEYISFKLAEVGLDKLGVAWPEFLLTKFQKQINNGIPVYGDIDHNEMHRLIKANAPDEELETRLREKPSIAKAVQAIFEKGKLWVKALIDKTFKKDILDSKGVSLEAVIERDENNNIIDGNLLGFTFGVNDDPVFEGTEVHINEAS